MNHEKAIKEGMSLTKDTLTMIQMNAISLVLEYGAGAGLAYLMAITEGVNDLMDKVLDVVTRKEVDSKHDCEKCPPQIKDKCEAIFKDRDLAI